MQPVEAFTSALDAVTNMPPELEIAVGAVIGVTIAITSMLIRRPQALPSQHHWTERVRYAEVGGVAAPVKLMRGVHPSVNMTPTGASKVKAKSLLTGNETEFWGRLRRALPQYEVAPQVSMGAIMDSVAARDWGTIERFRGKICDFVLVCRRTGRALAVIELDDKTHDGEKDYARDLLVAQVGVPTIRFESRAKPTEADIQQAVRCALS